MSLSKIAAWTQIACLCTAPAFGQSPQADRIHQQVDRIGSVGTITVKMRDGHEYDGTVGRIGAAEFTVNEVDLHREITLPYQVGGLLAVVFIAVAADPS